MRGPLRQARDFIPGITCNQGLGLKPLRDGVSTRSRNPKHMRYLPKSPAERLEMLKQIGAGSIDDLFAVIPEEYRLTRDLDVPTQMGESEIIDHFKQAAAANNSAGYASFLGAGSYRTVAIYLTGAHHAVSVINGE